MRKLLPHPIVADFPEMSPEEFAALKADIDLNGQREEIVILDGKILDGRHRYRACIELDRKPIFREFNPKKDGDPRDFVISKMSSRNRTESIKAVEAEIMIEHWPGVRGDGKRSEAVALRMGVGSSSVERVGRIRRESPKLYALIRSGRTTVNSAFNQVRRAGKARSVRKLKATRICSDEDSLDLRLGDNVEVIESLPSNSVRCAFYDPPYNNGWRYDGDRDRDNLAPELFVAKLAKVFAATHRVLTSDGSLFVLIDDAYSDYVGIELRKCGYVKRPTIIWHETFAVQQSDDLTKAARFLHYYTKTQDRVFNKDLIREPSARQTTYGDKRANPAGKIPSTVWQISRVAGTFDERVPYEDAPPQIPVELVRRAILMASDPGDKVLDAYNGNGITGIAALKNLRSYIGIDRSKKYLDQSRKWIAANVPSSKQLMTEGV